ncbi:hypothetical protein [Microbulbifer rhizosphaerae]|uniref:Putative membrane protein n=1 Tax=Microbulbifer rhizosphaerae TaxID=1562603 RepID=A0A7W4WBL5_9GAMM|nr:hypothetical protein [Microbulbifer rhizosphaerae]MBB3060561.1 putative membrane protein [Microbulbifer rhizosphaerae]
MEIHTVLIIHIVTGAIAVIAGFIGLLVKKGSLLHKRLGKGFVVAMLIMAGSGAIIAIVKPMAISTIAAAFTAYLVITSLWIVQNKSKQLSGRHYITPVVSAAIALAGGYCAFLAAGDEYGVMDGFGAEPYLFFAVLALICCILDIRLLASKGLTATHRLARHLWRMCFALFIAIGSFIERGAKILPESIQQSLWLELLDKLVLLVVLFWFIKLFISPRLKSGVPSPVTGPPKS